MFETGMSALVLKICSEYAKSLGLNFPPCTQQEINAICQWVDKHTVKDLTMEQNEDSVTFKFVTENDTTKEFTFTIPEQKVDIDVLEQLLIGSETVVVDRTEDNSALQVRLDQSVTEKINGKLDKPATPTTESAVVIGKDGTVNTKPLSEIGGGKLYNHEIYYSLTVTNIGYTTIYIYITTSSSTPFTQPSEFASLINRKVATIKSSGFTGTAAVSTIQNIIEIHGGGTKLSEPNAYATINLTLEDSDFKSDTVTEV